MRLQSLQIKGFKSFANDTIVYFNENVTGVVGPNGSGKSNIIDAIRWVLGEQKSRELRLEKMQDVIFNGTSKKKAANTAEVSISFENTRGVLSSDYHIVKISRVLYRSGESEYRLNDVPCRLKDIKNLLVDTGIGSNSYAIIELGMVDDILQDKDQARRRMFEQAAGISKYKSRKRETLSKLSLTQTDLDRVEDLLHEITVNLKALEKQARRAKKYLTVKEQYKESSILYHRILVDELVDQKLHWAKQVTSLQHDFRDIQASIRTQEAALEKDKLKNINDEKQLSLFQQKISSIADEIRKSESRKEILLNEIRLTSDRIHGLDKRVVANQEKSEQLNQQVHAQKARLQIEMETLTNLKNAHATAQSGYEAIKLEYDHSKDQLEAKEKEKQVLESDLLRIEKELAISQNKCAQAEHTMAFQKEKNAELLTRIETEKLQVKEAEMNLQAKEKQLKNLQQSEERKLEDIESLRAKIQNAQDQKRDVLRKQDIKDNEIQLLKSVINKLEGFPESMKYLQQKWNQKQVILSDIINCAEKYRPAVESFFGPYLDYYIVEDEKDALEAIQLLKTSNQGKAHFFIQNKLTQKAASNSLNLEGAVAMQSVLEIEDEYKVLIETLCAHVFIVENDAVIEVESANINLVSFDGSLLKNAHAWIGGSAGVLDTTKIGRKKKLENLQKEQAKLAKEILTIDKSITALLDEKKELEHKNFKTEIREIQQALDQEKKQQYQLQAKLESNEASIEQQTQLIQQYELTIKENTKKIKALESDKIDFTNLLNQLKSQFDPAVGLSKLSEKLSAASNALNQANIEQIKQDNLVQTLEKELEYAEEKIAETKAEINAANVSKNQILEKDLRNQKELTATQKALEEAYTKRKKETQDLGGIEQAYFEAKHKIAEAENELRSLNKKFNELQSAINTSKDKSSDINFKIEGIKQRIQIEFSVQLNQVDPDIPEDYNAQEQSLQIEKLKSQLANYGEVNPMAVQAYEEMESRKLNIETQRDDILEAKNQLVQTIQEIETTATGKFLESFEEARKHFKTVFRSLFTKDDTCDLILLDPENPLTSEIEIIAKPKGKRPQSLSQLSGGEKTLTASALLFSLYLLKPAPFCIFDEVDAPLDDQNVQKFTNIIRAFAQDSQFIVVTHNKATMAELDVLYGVYMEEKGVSSVSAVDFRNYDHQPRIQAAVG